MWINLNIAEGLRRFFIHLYSSTDLRVHTNQDHFLPEVYAAGHVRLQMLNDVVWT